MKQFKFYHPIWLSLYDKSLYRDVAKNWQNYGLLTLFVVLTLSWLPVMYQYQQQLVQYGEEKLPAMLRQLPKVTIHQGTLTVDHDLPYDIKNPQTEKTTIRFIKEDDAAIAEKDKSIPTVVTPKRIFVRDDQGEYHAYPISDYKDMSFDREQVQKLWEFMLSYGFGISYLLMTILSFAYRLLQGVLYAFILRAMAERMNYTFTYKQAFRLSMIAIIPSIWLSTFFDAVMVHFYGQFLLYFLVTLYYFYFAILANKTKNFEE